MSSQKETNIISYKKKKKGKQKYTSIDLNEAFIHIACHKKKSSFSGDFFFSLFFKDD